jgi:hypothetical protein
MSQCRLTEAGHSGNSIHLAEYITIKKVKQFHNIPMEAQGGEDV